MDDDLPSLLLKFSGTFEYELVIRLCLKHWDHPYADDEEYVNSLLESATEVLRDAKAGQQHIGTLPPEHMNLVAAMWYVESVADQETEIDAVLQPGSRAKWLATVRRSLPSCFCHPDNLM